MTNDRYWQKSVRSWYAIIILVIGAAVTSVILMAAIGWLTALAFALAYIAVLGVAVNGLRFARRCRKEFGDVA